TEAMEMMRPLRAFIMPRSTALDRRYTELRLVSRIRFQSSSRMRSRSWSRVMPALFTRMEIGPNSLPTASTRASTPALSVTSSTRPQPSYGDRRTSTEAAPAALVAVPTTIAPDAAKWSAMAAPMPRLAPVTKATSPCRLLLTNVSSLGRTKSARPAICTGMRHRMQRIPQGSHPLGQRGVHPSWRANGVGHEAPVDTLDQAAQYLARTTLGHLGRTVGSKRMHALGPAHRLVQLALQRAANFIDGRIAARVGILDDRDRRHLPLASGHAFAQAIGCPAHQRAMGRHRNRQLDCPLHAQPGQRGQDAVDRFGMAGNDQLPGRIEIGRSHDLALRQLRAHCSNLGIVAADDCRHGTHALGHRRLHEAAALGNQGRTIVQRQRTGTDQGAVFAQAVPREVRRLRAAELLPHP